MVNLKELIKWHPYHIRCFADFANVETELLCAAQEGEEELTADELFQISRYVKVPVGVLLCPHLIYLEKRRPKHQKMMKDLEAGLYKIWEAQKKGSEEADRYMRSCLREHLVNLELNFQNDGKVTYCRYLGVKEEIDQTLLFIHCEQLRRCKRGRMVR